MKSIISILSFLVAGYLVVPSTHQPEHKTLKLIMPDEAFLSYLDTNYDDEFLLYLDKYYNLDKTVVLEKYNEQEWGPEMADKSCAWKNIYQVGFSYQTADCEEAKNSTTIVLFPNVDKREVVNLINQLLRYEINSTDGFIKLTWNNDFTKLEPKDAGCYYIITEDENTVRVEYSCGC